MSIAERASLLWDKIRRTPARVPSRINISNDHVDEGDKLDTVIQKDKHYFQIRINEMYLAYEREWFKKYDPIVLIISEFIYGKRIETIPSVIGPIMMGKSKVGKDMPLGMTFSDIQVAGPHPYKGGSLKLTVVLSRLTVGDYLQKVLQIVESTASILDLSTALSASLKLANVVMDGIDTILGSEKTQPLIGLHKDFAVDSLKPGYFALIDIDENKLDVDKLWVRNRRLVQGKNLADAKSFQEADYVLYSIAPTQPPDRRGNISTLPFYSQWENVVDEASRTTADDWTRAKGHLFNLYRSMVLSPDLVTDEAYAQFNEWKTQAKKMHHDAILASELGPTKAKTPSEQDKIRQKEVEILES